MAGKNVWRLFHRVCLHSRKGALPFARCASSLVQKPTRPAWLLAAAPFVWDPPNVAEPHDDDEEYEDDDEEYEDDEEEDNVRGDMMKNWSANAESHPQYRKTVEEARRVLRVPPPPPPKFPEFPQGFCVDADKVPPIPPTLPTLKFLEFHDDNRNNSKKLPSSCPSKPQPIADEQPCAPGHLEITPKMPDLPFCDRPLPPPAMPLPPPCGELGPPPPPPPDPPIMMNKVERPPPPLPTPPPLSYALPPPPNVFEPQSNSARPPLPCLPQKLGQTSMSKCTNDNNDTIEDVPGLPAYEARGGCSTNNEAVLLPPPPPSLSRESMSTSSYWRDDSQHGMIATPQKPKLKKKRKKRKPVAVEGQTPETVQITDNIPQEEAPQPIVEQEPQEERFQVFWSSRGRKGR